MSSTKKRLIKRLSWYYPMEGFNAVLAICGATYLIYSYGVRPIFFLLYGLALMTFILIQGTIYWRAKLHRLQGKVIDQEKILHRFEQFELTNRFLLILMPLMFINQWIINGRTFTSENFMWWALLANLFAFAEHYNYYHKQLNFFDNPYDIAYVKRNKRLKIASLKKDMKEGKL